MMAPMMPAALKSGMDIHLPLEHVGNGGDEPGDQAADVAAQNASDHGAFEGKIEGLVLSSLRMRNSALAP